MPSKVPKHLTSIINKNASFRLKKFPIGFWCYLELGRDGKHINEAEVEDWHDAGFTLPKSPSFNPKNPKEMRHIRKMLDWGHKRGMKFILCDPRAGGRVPVTEAHRKEIAAAVNDFGKHPAVFGFTISDEPNKESNEPVFMSSRMVKEVSPKMHNLLNLGPYWSPGTLGYVGYPSWPAYLDDVVKKAKVDFLCWDCYTQMNPGPKGVEIYFENLRMHREASWKNGIPFWTTLCSVGHWHYRSPNYNDIRWQFNTAVCSGATGVLWFFYYMRDPHANYRYPPVNEFWEKTETYYHLRHVQKSFHRFYDDLFLNLAPTRISFFPKAIGHGDVFKPNEVIAKIKTDVKGHPILVGEFTDIKCRRYVMIVNNSTTDNIWVVMTFPGKDVKLWSRTWEGEEKAGPASSAGGSKRTDKGLRVGHWLAPGQETVYRVDSSLIRQAPMPKQRLHGGVSLKGKIKTKKWVEV